MMMSKLLKSTGSVFAALMLGGVPSYSWSEEASEWLTHSKWEGFISDTAVYSSDYQFFSESDDNVSFDLWEAGLLFSTKVYDEVTFSSQILGRRISQASGNDVRVDYAFFSFPVHQGFDHRFGARIGRIRSSFGFYNETRDIPHNRTGILMPQSVYYDMTRNSFYSADGIEFYYNRDLFDQPFSAQLFFSRPVADSDETEEAEFLNPENLEGDKGILVKLAYGSEFDGFRYAFTYYRPEYDVDVNFDVLFPLDDFGFLGVSLPVNVDAPDSSFYSETLLFSLEYNQLDWALTAEFSRHKFQTRINGDARAALAAVSLPGMPGTTLDILLTDAQIRQLQDGLSQAFYEENIYLQGLYRFNTQWESYLRYDYNKGRSSSFANPDGHWVDVNVGVTFRPDENWLLRTEWHYIDGRSRLLKRDNTIAAGQDRYWTAGLFQIAYRF